MVWYDFAHLNELNKFDCVCSIAKKKYDVQKTYTQKDIIISKTDCYIILYVFDKFKLVYTEMPCTH